MAPSITWTHYSIEFADRDTAEHHTAEALAPVLEHAVQVGAARRWWFLRKTPDWRLRYESALGSAHLLDTTLAGLAADGAVTRWYRGIYEPETVAFGGPAGLDVAHTLFHHDGRHLLLPPRQPSSTGHNPHTDGHRPPGPHRLGRRETSALLFSVLLRAAGLDWFEQGDVWWRVGRLRSTAPGHLAGERGATLRAGMRRLMLVRPETGGSAGAVDAPVTDLVDPDRVAAFATAGRDLAQLAYIGGLHRGLRAVLAHHFLFLANRAGLPATEQATLAALAVDTVYHTEPEPLIPVAGSQAPASDPTADHPRTPKVPEMPTTNSETTSPTPGDHTEPDAPGPRDAVNGDAVNGDAVNGDAVDVGEMDADDVDAAELRRRMVDGMRRAEALPLPAVERALAEVPRHLFLPGVPIAAAYANEPVYIKHDQAQTALSAASQPGIVAMMLGQLDVRPGHRILELGAGTGYNAALLAHLSGAAGSVHTVDVDDDLVDGARAHLASATAAAMNGAATDGAAPNGAAGVDVIRGDGALGYPDWAPYDRIIATVGAYEIPPTWLEQLAPSGRLVAPVRLAGAASRSLVIEQDGRGWVSRSSELAVFMPLRGIGDDARTLIDLTATGGVTLQTHADNAHATDPVNLAGVLDTPAHTEWTGVYFVPRESFEWLDLWLACHLPNPLMRLEVLDADAVSRHRLKPMFPTVAMASTTAEGALAYLTIRAAEPASDGTRRYEVGVIGHHDGPAGRDLAEQVSHHIRDWDRRARACSVTIRIPGPDPTVDSNPDDNPRGGQHGGRQGVVEQMVLTRPQVPMTLLWH